MGGGMAVNLASGGHEVTGVDKDPAALERMQAQGVGITDDAPAAVRAADVVFTSLTVRAYQAVHRELLLPNARAGQVFVDTSTLPVPEARRTALSLRERGVETLDAPVSGGAAAAGAGRLRIFVGGERAVFERMLPLFALIGPREKTVYGGPCGGGQILKVIQQTCERMLDCMRMEVLSFGHHSGVDWPAILAACGEDPAHPGPYGRLVEKIQAGDREYETVQSDLCCLNSEWPYYVEQCREEGFSMPMLEAMWAIVQRMEPVNKDGVHRPQASVWHALMSTKQPR